MRRHRHLSSRAVSGHGLATAGAVRGFTLLELMVAMAIFALLAAAGWKLFSVMMQSRERADRRAAQLLAGQEAYLQLLHDTRQMVARALPGADPAQPQPALLINSQRMAFAREAPMDWRHPSAARVQRVVYRLDQDRLLRERYSSESSTSDQPVNRLVLLQGVSNWRVQALNPEALAQWPAEAAAPASTATNPLQQASRLPRGLQVQFEQNGETRLWRFDLPVVSDAQRQQMTAQAPSSGATAGTASPTTHAASVAN